MLFLLPHAVDRSAQRFGDRQAVGFLDERLTYGQLARRANGLARVLIDQGVKRGDRVGILMSKSIRCPEAIHGIMKAGAAYVPLDPAV